MPLAVTQVVDFRGLMSGVQTLAGETIAAASRRRLGLRGCQERPIAASCSLHAIGKLQARPETVRLAGAWPSTMA